MSCTFFRTGVQQEKNKSEVSTLCYFETAKMLLKGGVMVIISTINIYMGIFYVGKKLCGKRQQLSANS